jgi:hypothetical protein
VNRTVVDLSLSFLVTVSFYNGCALPVIADEQRSDLERQLDGIDKVSKRYRYPKNVD